MLWGLSYTIWFHVVSGCFIQLRYNGSMEALQQRCPACNAEHVHCLAFRRKSLLALRQTNQGVGLPLLVRNNAQWQ